MKLNNYSPLSQNTTEGVNMPGIFEGPFRLRAGIHSYGISKLFFHSFQKHDRRLDYYKVLDTCFRELFTL
jgi:hypothetical protein